MALDPITAGLDLAKTVVQTIWPDKTPQEQAQLAAAVQMVQGQIDTNKAEATNPSVFVSGWRPFVGWVCGLGCAWNWVGLPIAKLGFALAGHSVNINPADVGEMMPLLMGMLGMAGIRSFDKLNGVANK